MAATTTASTAGGVKRSGSASHPPPHTDGTFDVVIVGAGASGLACAKRLLEIHPALRVGIFEGRDRVGGRTWAVSLGADSIDLGGQWVGPHQPRLLRLVKEYGIKLVSQKFLGAKGETVDEPMSVDKAAAIASMVRSHKSGIQLNSGADVSLSPQENDELEAVILELEAMAKEVGAPGHVNRTERVLRWDGMSAADFLRGRVRHASVLREILLLIQTVLAIDPSDISLLYVLYLVRCAGGLERLGDYPGGSQTWKMLGGAQQISTRIAEDVMRDGGQLFLNSVVTNIEYRSNGVALTVRRRKSVNSSSPSLSSSSAPTSNSNAKGKQRIEDEVIRVVAARAVVAIPPTLYKTITFLPPLPTARRAFADGMVMGSVVKVVALYPTPWWQDCTPKGFLEDHGPVANVFPAFYGTQPALVGLITGNAAKEFAQMASSADSPSQPGPSSAVTAFEAADQAAREAAEVFNERRNLVLSQYAAYFGSSEALNASRVEIKDWISDPLSGGGFGGVTPPGVLSKSGSVIRKPLGCLHWAASETATAWPGYIEGAVESGFRAANEVHGALSAAAAKARL